jgi:hypothetical protein
MMRRSDRGAIEGCSKRALTTLTIARPLRALNALTIVKEVNVFNAFMHLTCFALRAGRLPSPPISAPRISAHSRRRANIKLPGFIYKLLSNKEHITGHIYNKPIIIPARDYAARIPARRPNNAQPIGAAHGR